MRIACAFYPLLIWRVPDRAIMPLACTAIVMPICHVKMLTYLFLEYPQKIDPDGFQRIFAPRLEPFVRPRLRNILQGFILDQRGIEDPFLLRWIIEATYKQITSILLRIIEFRLYC